MPGSWLAFVKLAAAAPMALAWLVGVVSDEQNRAPIAGATVTLVDLDRRGVTDSSGAFRLEQVPPGPQHVQVRRVGYAPLTFHALVPSQGPLVIDISLRPDPMSIEPIEVQAALPVRGSEGLQGSRYPDRGLSIAAVRRHPLVAESDILEATSGGEVIVQPESPSGVHVRGGASDHLAHLIDGIPVLSPYHAGGTFSSFNPDAISRIDLLTSPPPCDGPDALAGVFVATTRAPVERLQVRGGLSTTQARITIDRPFGDAGASGLIALRTTFPGLAPRLQDNSYLGGKGRDWLAKGTLPTLGGKLSAIGHGSTTEIGAAAIPPDVNTEQPRASTPRHSFGGDSYSYGGVWHRNFESATVELRGWRAVGDSEARWHEPDSLVLGLETRRTDDGALAQVEFGASARRTLVGVRVEEMRTSYEVRSAPGDSTAAFPATPPALSIDTRTPITSAFLQHQHTFGSGLELTLSLTGAFVRSDFRPSPSAVARWKPSEVLDLTIGYSRRHQFAQSLRNPESVVSNIFPIDLFVGAAPSGTPVARSHTGFLAIRHHALLGFQCGAQVYANDSEGLALVAPRDGEPFATSGFVRGSGSTRGAAFEVSRSRMRYTLLGSYGVQRSKLEGAGGRYTPQFAAGHSLATGLLFYPNPSTSLRLGVTADFGRRATPTVGFFEWEACNLLDQGCEFAGSPIARADALGSTRLPPYLRVDLGFRKHWHVDVADRDAEIAIFGVVTNLLGRINRLTAVQDPVTGRETWIDMRPRSPLVAGLEWRF